MWAELSQVLIGLAGALAVLVAIYAFIAAAQGDTPREELADGQDGDRTPREAHRPLSPGAVGDPRPATDVDRVPPRVERIFIAAAAAAPMRQVAEVEAVAGRGLDGDRYALGRGHWSESDQHEVTLIMQEDLDAIAAATGLAVQAGEHRRNIVTRGVDPQSLIGKRFRVGSAFFSAARPRPPCLYLQQITAPGMARALVGRGGVGARCFHGGRLREHDPIVVLDLSLRRLIARRWAALFLGSARGR